MSAQNRSTHKPAEPGLLVDLQSQSPVRLQVQFHCAAGEVIGLVGPSGAGKTTVLRVLAGVQTAERGSIVLHGKSWFDSQQKIHLSPQQRRVGLVFQQYALFPHLSALGNVQIARPRDPAACINLLARLGLGEVMHQRPSQLSGGQQQRVALARALIREPELLLLDEPFSAVDQVSREALYRELANLREQLAMPIVLVTHDLHEASRLCDRLVIIDQGQTLQAGTPHQVLTRPRNAHVAQLVGVRNHFAGIFRKSREAGWAQLQWCPANTQHMEISQCSGPHLLTIDKNLIQDNSLVTWVIAGEFVEVFAQAPDAATGNQPANLLCCRLLSHQTLGEVSWIEAKLLRPTVEGGGDSELPALALQISTSLLRQMKQQDGKLWLRIDPEGLHIMPKRLVQSD